MKQLSIIDVLHHFTASDERPTLEHPWSRDGWVYAADGSVLLRVRATLVPEVEPNEDAPSIGQHITDALDAMADLRQTDTLPKAVTLSPEHVRPDACGECAGFGALIPCPSCDGDDGGWCSVCDNNYDIGGEAGRVCPECHGTGHDEYGDDNITLGRVSASAWVVEWVNALLPGALWRAFEGADKDKTCLLAFASGVYRGVVAGELEVQGE